MTNQSPKAHSHSPLGPPRADRLRIMLTPAIRCRGVHIRRYFRYDDERVKMGQKRMRLAWPCGSAAFVRQAGRRTTRALQVREPGLDPVSRKCVRTLRIFIENSNCPSSRCPARYVPMMVSSNSARGFFQRQ